MIDQRLSNGQMLHVRVATGWDAPAILAFLHVVCAETDYLSFGPGEFEMTLEDEMEYLELNRAADNRLYLIATVDAIVVATISFDGGARPRTSHTGEFGVSVRKSHWSLGIASLLLDAMVDWAEAGGVVKKINLRVRSDNERAVRLYKRKGWEAEGTIRRDLLVNGVYYDHLTMGRLIEPAE